MSVTATETWEELPHVGTGAVVAGPTGNTDLPIFSVNGPVTYTPLPGPLAGSEVCITCASTFPADVTAFVAQQFTYDVVVPSIYTTLMEFYTEYGGGIYESYFPTYDDFVAAVIDAYGSEAAGLAGLIASDSTVTTHVEEILAATQRTWVQIASVPVPEATTTTSLSQVSVAERPDIDAPVSSQGYVVLTASPLHTTDSTIAFLQVGPGSHSIIDSGSPMPYDEWVTVTAERTGTNLTQTVVSASGTLLASHTWDLTVDFTDPVIFQTASYTADGLSTYQWPYGVYEDTLTWTYVPHGPAPVPPVVVVTAHPTRLFPRDDGNGLSSSPRLFPVTKGNGGRVVGGY